jgi:hypothetical protein
MVIVLAVVIDQYQLRKQNEAALKQQTVVDAAEAEAEAV